MKLKFEVAQTRPMSNNVHKLGSLLWTDKTYLSTFTPNEKSNPLWNSSMNLCSKST